MFDENVSYVIAAQVEGRPDDAADPPVPFNPGEVALVREVKGDEVLVVSANAASRGGECPAWVPRGVLLHERDFEAVTSWPGQPTLHRPWGSPDVWADYAIAPDGTFTALFHDREEPARPGGLFAAILEDQDEDSGNFDIFKPTQWSGRLYRHGGIVWFREDDDTRRGFDALSLLVLDADGNLCEVGGGAWRFA